MRQRLRFVALGAVLLLVAGPVLAHPGHLDGDSGFLSGVLHPLLGVDHLVTMVMVGIWAGQMGGRARVVVPVSFVSLMALGALLTLNDIRLPLVEAGISASLIVIGLMVALSHRLNASVAAVLVGGFALFHGAAHAAELPSLSHAQGYVMGFLLATGLLHATGLGLAITMQERQMMPRLVGAASVATGLAFAWS